MAVGLTGKLMLSMSGKLVQLTHRQIKMKLSPTRSSTGSLKRFPRALRRVEREAQKNTNNSGIEVTDTNGGGESGDGERTLITDTDAVLAATATIIGEVNGNVISVTLADTDRRRKKVVHRRPKIRAPFSYDHMKESDSEPLIDADDDADGHEVGKLVKNVQHPSHYLSHSQCMCAVRRSYALVHGVLLLGSNLQVVACGVIVISRYCGFNTSTLPIAKRVLIEIICQLHHEARTWLQSNFYQICGLSVCEHEFTD